MLYKTFTRFFLLISLILSQTTIFAQNKKPNIVWITIEDTSPDFIGCYGNKQAVTPHIDSLATIGIKYTNAHSTNTICSPSRHTIITGVRTAADGAGHHRSTYNMPSFVKGFAYYLKQAGYYTTNNHKTDYNLKEAQQFTNQNWNEQGGKADFENRKDKTQPFFAVFNVDESHQSRSMSSSYAWYQKNVLTQLSEKEIILPNELILPPFYKNSDSNRKYMARMYNSLQAMDKKVGQIVKKIKDAGEWDNTIVFFFSDHGQGMPRFKANASRLGTQVPFIIRLPAQYKHLSKSINTNSDAVSFEDLAPTMLSIATDLSIPNYLKGRIFLGPNQQKADNTFWGCRDNTDEVIDMGRVIISDGYVYSRTYYPHLPLLQKEVYFEKSDIVTQMRKDFEDGQLDSLQKSIFQSRDAEYLFDIKNDPWETNNLAKDKKYASQLLKMRKLNHSKIKSYQDIGFLPQNVLAQIDESDTLLTWKNKNYKVAQYLAIAETVGMGRQHITTQMKALQSTDSVMRYWAAIGLLNQPKIFLNLSNITKIYEKEKSVFVKIELADLLVTKFENKDALHFISNVITENDNAYLVRQAAMKLANKTDLPSTLIADIKSKLKTLLVKHKGTLSYPISSALGTITKQLLEKD